MKADKGNATVVMNTTDYEAKMVEHLTTTGCYKKLTKDPGKSICRTVTKAIKESNLDKEIKLKLYPKYCLVPRIYGLPKIHKQGAPLRPIVNTIGSPSYKLATYLANLLKPLVGKTNSFVKDSETWVEEISKENLNPEDKLVSFDVVSLYTKIPVDEAVDTIK